MLCARYLGIMCFLAITEVPIIVRTIDEGVEAAADEEAELNIEVGLLVPNLLFVVLRGVHALSC
jgi:hypothetical protein